MKFVFSVVRLERQKQIRPHPAETLVLRLGEPLETPAFNSGKRTRAWELRERAFTRRDGSFREHGEFQRLSILDARVLHRPLRSDSELLRAILVQDAESLLGGRKEKQ
jgi:hypothetical protein